MNDELRAAASRLLDELRARKLMVATAESCTGGLIAACLTDISGSSEVLDRGFVTYSNEAKQAMLDVPQKLLEQHGSVSRETALAMAAGALKRSKADLAVSVTGVAGPGGGSAEKPVGLVHFGAAARNGPSIHRERRFGAIGRTMVREQSVLEAFALLHELASGAKIDSLSKS